MSQDAASNTNGLEAQIRTTGLDLWGRIRGQVPGIFNKGYWQGRMLEWAMADPSFKIDLFRFVDVLPALQSSEQISSHMREYLLKPGRELPTLLGAAIKLASGGFASALAAKAIRKNVTDMAERFIVGRNAAEALPVLKDLHKQGFAFTVDLLGEATTSDAEGEVYQKRYLDLIENLVDQVNSWPADEIIDEAPRANVSIKLSAMEEHLDAVDPAGSVERLLPRVLPLFLRAREKGVFLNVDMEQWALNGITYDVFDRIVTHEKLRDWPHVGIVVQAYLKKSPEHVQRLLELARKRGAPITVRLVKGAYWDYEVVIAQQNGYECPVFTSKSETDANYERLSETMLRNTEHLRPAFASHNLRSLTHAIVLADRLKIPRKNYEIQMLYGMAEPERAAVRSMGKRVRLYTPIGELLPGMAYLVRRLLENTSNSGFLKLSYHDQADINQLLTQPVPSPDGQLTKTREAGFTNCPLTDFTSPSERRAFETASGRWRLSSPIEVPVVIAGQKRTGRKTFDRECPNDLSRIISRVSLATAEDADAAVRSAHEAWPNWRDTTLEQRAELLHRLGERLQKDRHDLAAFQLFEVGKPAREADADVAEAVDFCHYYAKQAAIELSPHKMGDIPGEDNVMHHDGRGVAVIIAPWNFPLAILTGMATAALVAGNTVILKPAEQSSAIAYQLYQRMIEVGFDPKVVHFVPGLGEEVGAALVDHPLVAQIAFTGSMSVGLKIMQSAAVVRPGQPQVKRVVCEMGGKNAIIVDEDADLDEAVVGVMRSAFGYSGQKCSAGSRVVVVGSACEPFIARLTDACRSLNIRPADDPACQLGPVIDRDAFERLKRVIADPGPSAKPLYVGEPPTRNGYFVAPAIFEVGDAQHRLMCEEFFGPVLAVMNVETFDRAIDVANASAYKLTGAVFSRSPEHLKQARSRFRVGNLYLNRGSTGAIVGRQPFGGFGMSGAGTKAGGPGYLLNFADPRVVCENTLRRGVAPELEITTPVPSGRGPG
ncbi:MAG TPA: proline dehydrogenase family protein [Tepidisphaeraceae bacterium]|jgi:RHH-type proline utilization regulon transcriptional repressor/proline dehydrogenase/delta 1-pyrroline-5-carboxylate dehydrogenase